MSNPSETLVRWYLRFNGYLTVQNLVVHEPTAGVVPQGAEFDVVGVRFPYSREVADFQFPRDPDLVCLEKPGATNVVIADVKGGRGTALSDVWLPDTDDALQLARLAYLVRWLGFWEREAVISDVAKDLRQRRVAEHQNITIRPIYFGARPSRQAESVAMPQVLLSHIAEWIVTTRASCWRDQDVAKRSCHDQWDSFIKDIWNLADPDLPGSVEHKIASIVALAIGRVLP